MAKYWAEFTLAGNLVSIVARDIIEVVSDAFALTALAVAICFVNLKPRRRIDTTRLYETDCNTPVKESNLTAEGVQHSLTSM